MEIEGYQIIENYYYEPTHAWMRLEDDGTVTVGLDDFGQKAAGNIVFIDLPDEGTKVMKGQAFISLESSKWIGKINSPVTGAIIEVNEELWDNPRLVNEDPFNDGWIMKVKPEKLKEEKADLVTGDALADWIRTEIKEKLE
jgi:glycine cleavage system H protein